MIKLGVQYGISGNGLAKICDRLNIPYPPRGHWAKKAAGKVVKKAPLPKAKTNTPDEVAITPTPPAMPLPDGVKEAVDTVREKATAIAIPDQLVRPHPLVAEILRSHAQRMREAKRSPYPLWDAPKPFTEVDHRLHRLLDALLKALERQGLGVGINKKGQMVAEYKGETIPFQMREKCKYVRKLKVRERSWGSADGYTIELEPTGKLLFKIDIYQLGLRTEWLETETKTMESFLPDILATFVAAGPLLVEQTRRRAEEERQRQITAQKRYEDQQRRKRDDNRWHRFSALAQGWDDLKTTRAFLDALKTKAPSEDMDIDGKPLSEWIAWAEARLEEADPLHHGVEAIFQSVAEVTEWTYRD